MPVSVLQVSRHDGKLCGAAFACAPRGFLLTCYHVIADALGLTRTSSVPEGTQVLLTSPTAPWMAHARVIATSPLKAHDLALLRIDDSDIPSWLISTAVFDVPLKSGVPVRAYGFPDGYDQGVWAYGTLKFPVAWHRYQIEAAGVYPGFSGAPVEELQMNRVIGLISASDLRRNAVFIITAAEIAAFTQALGIVRPRSAYEILTEGLIGLPGDPLSGLEHFLDEYLGTVDNTVPFGGRDSELRRLDEWLSDSGASFGIVTAPAGRGKSALLARWAAKTAASGAADVVFVPISNRFETARRNAVLGLLGKRLRFLCGGDTSDTPAGGQEWLAEIGVRLREDRISATKPLLIIIDGLDEAADWIAGRDLDLPSAIGRGFKILVSARILGGDPDEHEWLRRLHWKESAFTLKLGNLDRHGIAEVVAGVGGYLTKAVEDTPLVDQLMRLSQGDPLIISLYVGALRGVQHESPFLSVAELPQLPPGLEGFMDRWMEDQRRQWQARGDDAAQMESDAKSFLYTLSFAYGPLSNTDIGEVAPADAGLADGLRLRELVRIVSRFVIGDGERQGYVFSHPRLKEYFSPLVRSSMDRRTSHQRYTAYGDRTLRGLQAGTLRLADVSRYIVQNYRLHLVQAEASADEFYRLASKEWLDAWFALEGSYSGFLADIAVVWRQARFHKARAIEVLCCLCNCSTVSISSQLSPDVLYYSLREGVMTPEQVLATIGRMDQERLQAESLILIAPLLQRVLLEAALDTCRSFVDTKNRLIATVALGSNLDEPRRSVVLNDALSTISTLPQTSERDTLLARIGPFLPASYHRVFVSMALQTWDELNAARILSSVAGRLELSVARRLLTIAAMFRWDKARVVLLRSLGPELGRLRVAEAYSASMSLTRAEDRAGFLVLLCSNSGSRGLGESALSVIRQIRDEGLRSELLTSLSAHLPSALDGLFLEVAQSLKCENLRARSLCAIGLSTTDVSTLKCVAIEAERFEFPENRALAGIGALARSSAANRRILEVAREIRDPFDRSHVLIDVIWAQRSATAWLLAEEVFQIIMNGIDRHDVVPLLARAAPVLENAQLGGILAMVLDSEGPSSFDKLRCLLPYLTKDQLELVVDSLRPIADLREQALFFSSLSDFAFEGPVEDVLGTLGRLKEDGLSGVCLAGLARQLPSTFIADAFAIASAIGDPSIRTSALVDLALGMEKSRALDAILSMHDLSSSTDIELLLKRLAPILDERALFAGIELCRTRLSDSERVSPLNALLPRLPAAFRYGLVAHASELGSSSPQGGLNQWVTGGPEDVDRSLDEVLSLVSSIPTPCWRTSCRIALLAKVSRASQASLLELITADLDSVERAHDRTELLERLVRSSGAAASPESITTIVKATVDVHSLDDQVALIGALASRVRGRMISALVTACRGLDRRALACALKVVAPHSSDIKAQWSVLSALRMYFGKAKGDRVASTDIEFQDDISAQVMIQLAPHLRYSPLFPKALHIVRWIENPRRRVNALKHWLYHSPLTRHWGCASMRCGRRRMKR